METAILTSVISGLFSLGTALTSVWLKHNLEQRAAAAAQGSPRAPTERETVRGERGWSISRPSTVFLGGFVIGVMSRILRPEFESGGTHYEMLASLLLLAIICVVLMLNHRRARRGFWPYQLEVLALWAAFASGWSVNHGSVWSDLVSMTIMWWLLWALVGGIVVLAFRRRVEPA